MWGRLEEIREDARCSGEPTAPNPGHTGRLGEWKRWPSEGQLDLIEIVQ